MKSSFIALISILLPGCILRPPSLNITDKYIEVKNPGQSWALVELKNTVIDSLFGYPKTGTFVQSFIVVDRKTERPIRDRVSLKMFFFNQSKKYKWKNYRDIALQESHYLDTVQLKQNTWYTLNSYNSSYQLYLFWDKNLGNFIIKEKPKTASW